MFTLIFIEALNIFYFWLYGKRPLSLIRKEGNALYNDTLNTFVMVIWHWAYGKGQF